MKLGSSFLLVGDEEVGSADEVVGRWVGKLTGVEWPEDIMVYWVNVGLFSNASR